MSATEIIAAPSANDVSYAANIAISIVTVPIGGGISRYRDHDDYYRDHRGW